MHTTSLPPAAWSSEVALFAAERGVAATLPEVLAMTSRLFANSPITVGLEDDPETADRVIVFAVDVAGMEEESLYTAQRQWTARLFQHCPPAHVQAFRLGLWASA